MKLYRIHLFKVISINFSHSLQTTLESPASLSDGLLVQICKCGLYPCLQFIFGVPQTYLAFRQPLSSHTNKSACNLWKLAGICWDDDAEIFSRSRLGSAYVARKIVLLPDLSPTAAQSSTIFPRLFTQNYV